MSSRHPILSRLNLADRLYPLFCALPGWAKGAVCKRIAKGLTARASATAHPERVTLFLTERCNLRCAHCFVSKPGAQLVQELTTEQWKEFFTHSAGRISQLLITGGEPTLRKDLSEIVLAAANIGQVPAFSLFTNGQLPDRLRETVDAVLAQSSAQLNFQVSVDGPAEFHNANRGVAGSLDKVYGSIAMLREFMAAHPGRIGRVVACTALSRRNLTLLPQIVAEVERAGALHSFTFVRSSDTGVFRLGDKELLSEHSPTAFGNYLDVKGMEQALESLRELVWRKNPGSLFYATNRVILEGIATSLKQGGPMASPCRSGVTDMVILSDGSVARCEMLKTFGSLPENGMDLGKLLSLDVSREHFRKTSTCWCVHDCAVGLSIMFDRTLLERLFSRPV